MLTSKAKRIERAKTANKLAALAISKIPITTEILKLIASILFWTEGGKSTNNFVYFTNSDDKMVQLFIHCLRKSFPVRESKFRALLHLHAYHNEKQQLEFWSKTTHIPTTQFSKTYIKPNTTIRIRENYQGCIRIRYYDSKIALELRSIYNTFAASL